MRSAGLRDGDPSTIARDGVPKEDRPTCHSSLVDELAGRDGHCRDVAARRTVLCRAGVSALATPRPRPFRVPASPDREDARSTDVLRAGSELRNEGKHLSVSAGSRPPPPRPRQGVGE